MSPLPTNIPITFRLIRTTNDDAKHDDIIKIYGNENDGYSIVYTDNDPSDETTSIRHRSLMYMTGDEVDTYIHGLIVLLLEDDDPFYGLQVVAPGFPSILLPIPALRKKKVQRCLHTLLPLLTNFWRD